MKPVLIHLRPLDKRTNTRVDVRVADGPNAEIFGTGGVRWEPAIIARPQNSIELFSADMDGAVQAGRSRFEIKLDSIVGVDRPRGLYWRGAPVTIHSDGVLEGPSAIPEFEGVIVGDSLDRETGRLAVTAQVSTMLLDAQLLTLSFDGGGGLGGDGGRRGVLKPAGFGTVANIEPVWFDLTRNIGMIDGYGNTLSIGWLGEGRSSYGPRVADYASYAALAAAIDGGMVPPGRWATCVAEGLVGLGAPPAGVITVDAVFGYNRPGGWIRRVLEVHAGIATAKIDTASFTALDAAVDRPTHYWTAAQRDVQDLVQAIARSCNATPLVTFQGKVAVTRAVLSTPSVTLDLSGGQEPRVLDSRRGTVDAPFAELKARTARPARVLSFDEFNFVDTIDTSNGLYSAVETYRAGDVVWLADGSQWLFINDTAGAGHALPAPSFPPAEPAANAYWQQLLPPTRASDIKYAGGETIEQMKPRDPGATAGAGPTDPVGDTTGGIMSETMRALTSAVAIDASDAPENAAQLIARSFAMQVSRYVGQIASFNQRVRLEELGHLEGVPLGVRIRQEIEDLQNQARALVEMSASVESQFGKVTAAHRVEVSARQSGDSAQAQATSELAVAIGDDIAAVTSLVVAAAEDAASQLATVAATLGAEIDGVASGLSAETSARIDDIAEQTSARLALASEIADDIAAAIVLLTSGYQDGDEALATSLIALSSEVDTVASGLSAETSARIDDIAEQTTARLALVSEVDALGAEIDGVASEVDTVASGLSAETSARIDAIAEQTTARLALASEIADDIAAGIALVTSGYQDGDAALATSLIALSSEVDTVASEVDGVASEVDGVASEVDAVAAGLSAETSARIDDIAEQATALIALAAQTDADIASAVSIVTSAYQAADGDLTAAQVALGSELDDLAAALVFETEASLDRDDAQTMARLAMAADIGDDISAGLALVTSGYQDGDAALAESQLVLAARVSRAASGALPLNFASPDQWTSEEQQDAAAPFAATDSRFVLTSDGRRAFVVTAPGVIAPLATFQVVAGEIYRATWHLRRTVNATNGGTATFHGGFAARRAADGGFDYWTTTEDGNAWTLGEVRALTHEWTVGSTGYRWARPRLRVLNGSANGTWELVGFEFENVTRARAASAAVVIEAGARADGDSAEALARLALTSTVDGHTSTLGLLNEIVVDPQTGVTYKGVLAFNAAGKFIGFVNTITGELIGTIDIVADLVRVVAETFEVAPEGGGGFKPFSVSGGVVYLDKARIKDADIDTLKIAGQAVTVGAGVTTTGYTLGFGATTNIQVLTYSLVMPQAGQVLLTATGKQHYLSTSLPKGWQLQFSVDSTLQESSRVWGEEFGQDSIATSLSIYLAAGTYSIGLVWAGHSQIRLEKATMGVLASFR